MKKALSLSAVFAALVLSLAGCGGKALGPNVKVIETIPANVSSPKWVESTKEFWEEKGAYFYRGLTEGMTNIQASKRSAQATAVTQMAEQIKATIRNEFSYALEAGAYDPTSGGYVKDVFMSVVDNLAVSGAVAIESYSQKVAEITDGNDGKVYWRSYVLLKIKEEDYKKLVKAAFDKTGAQLGANKSAKELTKETEKRFFEKEAQNAKD